MKHQFVVFDTETSGLPDWNSPADSLGQPRVASAALIFLNADFQVEHEVYRLVKPDGWVMPEEVERINGLSTERLEAEGAPIGEILDDYAMAIDEGRIIVAHNAQFDTKMMRGELRRAQRSDRKECTKSLCTMRGLTQACQLPGRSGFKFPRLHEATRIILGEPELEGAHNALIDARACMRLLLAMRDLNMLGRILAPLAA